MPIRSSSLGIFLGAFLGWILIIILVEKPILLTALLALIAIGQLVLKFTRARLAFAILVSVIDSVWEIGMIRAGQYIYTGGLPSLGGMPLWLPVAWIVAGLAMIELYEFLKSRMRS